jgi:hypothetical protein
MSDPELFVIAGALARSLKPKVAQAQDGIARRWRAPAAPDRSTEVPDVIPLLDGWIRRLEREAGPDPASDRR